MSSRAGAAGEQPTGRRGDGSVAAFDFDGTLTVRDTLGPFLHEVAGAGRLLRVAGAHLAPMLLSLGGLADRDRVKETVVEAVFAGRDHASVAAQGVSFARDVIDNRMRPEAVARLRWHVARGHEVVIVSASLDVYLRPVAQELGVTAVLCSTLEELDGRCTGRLVGGNCRGPEKVARLIEHLAGRRPELWAYGNSSGDREMLARADRAFRVNGRRGRLADVTARPD